MNMNIEMLALEDFAGLSEHAVKAKIAEDFEIPSEALDGIRILVAYMSVGSWGCDSAAFIVFEQDGLLYEVNGSHCSCYGFGSSGHSGDGHTQWQPEPVGTVEAILKRDSWALAAGGYDSDREGNATAIKQHLMQM